MKIIQNKRWQPQNLDGSNSLHPYVPELYEQYKQGVIPKREFLRLASLLGVAVASPLSLAHGAQAQSTKAPIYGGTLRYSVRLQEIADPAQAEWIEGSNIFRQGVEYLTMVDHNNISRPYLATSWKPSNDLKSWHFTLRQGVKWSNGDVFDVRDVKFNFERWVHPESKSVNKNIWKNLTDVEIIDDYNFVLHLNKASLSVPEDLYQYSCAILHRNFNDNPNWAKNPVSTGPFLLQEYNTGSVARMKRNDAYWNGKPYLDAIEFIDLGDYGNADVAALISSQIHMLYILSIPQIDAVTSLPHLQLNFAEGSTYTFVLRMQVDKPPYDDIRVRRAITLATNNQKVNDLVTRSVALTAENHHVASVHPEYAPLPPLVRDVPRAKQLLQDAGYDNGLDIEISLGNTTGVIEQNLAQVVANELLDAGIRLKLNVLPAAQYWPIWDKADFALTQWAHRPLGVMVQNLAYRSDAVWNETHYNNPAYDKLLDKANSIVDPIQRRTVMADIEKTIQDDSIILQPFFYKFLNAQNKAVKGYVPHPSGYHLLHKVWLDA